MRQIEITDEIINYAEKYLKDLDASAVKANMKLLKNKINQLAPPYKAFYDDYIDVVHNCYESIVTLQPKEEGNPFQWFEDLYPGLHNMTVNALKYKLKLDLKGKQKILTFANWLIEAMDYNRARTVYWKYAKKMNIHTCIYCNVQYVDVFTNKNGKVESTSTIDHYKSKIDYPFLCTSFFNFIPCCSHCNQVKSKNDIPFYLYIKKGVKPEEVLFSLRSTSVINYFRTFQADDLDIELTDSNDTHNEAYINRLNLKKIYNEHVDVAEEIIWHSIVYTKSLQDSLKEQFKFLNSIDFKRFMLGTYASPNEIFMRPLTKMQQDLWNKSLSDFLEELIIVIKKKDCE